MAGAAEVRSRSRTVSRSARPTQLGPAYSMRNLGQAEESVRLLTEELRTGKDELSGAVQAFLALALVDVGREREAVAVSLTELSAYLPRYNRSLARYAEALLPQ